jgi:hypothetical protein
MLPRASATFETDVITPSRPRSVGPSQRASAIEAKKPIASVAA